MIAGYLLIYNVLYISVTRDVRFYGLLKAIGATSKQIWQLLFKQVSIISLIGIPLGLLSAGLISFIIVPLVIESSSVTTGAVVSFSPYVFVGATLFSLLTSYIGAMIPAKKGFACFAN